MTFSENSDIIITERGKENTFLNKKEQQLLIQLVKQKIRYLDDCPYELTTILEKLSPNDYEYLFKTMK